MTSRTFKTIASGLRRDTAIIGMTQKHCGFMCACGCGQLCACGLDCISPVPYDRQAALREHIARAASIPLAAGHPAPPDPISGHVRVICGYKGCQLALNHMCPHLPPKEPTDGSSAAA